MNILHHRQGCPEPTPGSPRERAVQRYRQARLVGFAAILLLVLEVSGLILMSHSQHMLGETAGAFAEMCLGGAFLVGWLLLELRVMKKKILQFSSATTAPNS